MAALPKRCQHIKVNGTLCGSPALRDQRYCYFHERFFQERMLLGAEIARNTPPTFDVPTLEDANSIQSALAQVMRLIVARQIEHKSAALLLYALQTASSNLGRTDFEPVMNDVVFDKQQAAETPLESNVWDEEDFDDDETDEESEEDASAQAEEEGEAEEGEDEAENEPAATSRDQLAAKVSPSGKATLAARHSPEAVDIDAIRANVLDIIRKANLPPPCG